MKSAYNIGLVMEQTLGHVTHTRNLNDWLDHTIVPHWMHINFEANDKWQIAPVIGSNWTLRASLRTRDAVVMEQKQNKLDALFLHTQCTALFAPKFSRVVPTVISLDATPLNLDTLGAAYEHRPSGKSVVDKFKHILSRRAFHSAHHLVTWCQWAKDSLVSDYGICPSSVTVIPPGIDLAKWSFDKSLGPIKRVRLLFVGGDFRRKGGAALLEAFGKSLQTDCQLDIVTREEVDISNLSNVFIHHGLDSNSAKLLRLYADADIFVFPTLGDCLPIAVMEAMAAKLPVIATNVGAISEEVDEGKTGLLIPPSDANALIIAVRSLTENRGRLLDMGLEARRQAEIKFDGGQNYRKLLELLKSTADKGLRHA